LRLVPVESSAFLAPGELTVDDFLAGRSGVSQLSGEYPLSLGGKIDQDTCAPNGWRFELTPRALFLADQVMNRLAFEADDRLGLVLGMSNLTAEPDYLEDMLRHRDDPEAMAPVLGFSADYCLSFLADKHGITGPRLRVDSACASGSDAVIVGSQWMQAGLVDHCVVVAAASMLNPVGMALFHNLRCLSTIEAEWASCPFDRRRNGFVMGEGAAAVYLGKGRKPPRGYVAGYGQSMNAHHFTHPGNSDQMVLAARQAMGAREDIAFVSAHGTATPINDVMETELHQRLFRQRAADIPISALKSMTGHCLGASALIEAIVALECLGRQMATPTINLRVPDPQCDAEYLADGCAPVRGRYALSHAFAFGGHNSVLLLEVPD